MIEDDKLSLLPVEQHPLPPFLPPDGRLLMLGSFPPPQKRWARDFYFYYPNFSNDMWRVLGSVFYADPLHFVDVAAKTYRKPLIEEFLSRTGIGIFDTASAVRRLQDNASDKFLEVVTPTDVESLLQQMPQCHTIVTTGQKATDTICQHFAISQPAVGKYVEFPAPANPADMRNHSTLRLYRMPSTSRAYPLPLARKAEAYRAMFAELGFDV